METWLDLFWESASCSPPRAPIALILTPNCAHLTMRLQHTLIGVLKALSEKVRDPIADHLRHIRDSVKGILRVSAENIRVPREDLKEARADHLRPLPNAIQRGHRRLAKGLREAQQDISGQGAL